MPQFWVMNDDADLCYLVTASSRMDAKMTVFNLVKNKTETPQLASLRRLVEVAKQNGLNPMVMLRTEEAPEVMPGIISLNE